MIPIPIRRLSLLKPRPKARPRARVVVTGLGLVTCLGVGTHHVWKKIVEGKSGISNVKGEGHYLCYKILDK